MNILIVGGGLLGRKTAELLDEAGHTVSVLGESADSLSLLSPEFGGMMTVGMPMEINSLRSAGIEGCDAVAVVTADDNMNITVGQIAKDFFHVPKVIARISDPQRETIFEGFGLSSICPTNMAGEKLAAALVDPWREQQVTFGTTTVALTAVPIEKHLVGRTTAELLPTSGAGVFGVLKGTGKLLLLEPHAALPLESGDRVIYSRKID